MNLPQGRTEEYVHKVGGLEIVREERVLRQHKSFFFKSRIMLLSNGKNKDLYLYTPLPTTVLLLYLQYSSFFEHIYV